MKTFSRSILSVLAISLIAGCSDEERHDMPTPTPAPTSTQALAETPTPSPAPSPTEEPSPTPSPTPDPALSADADRDGWSVAEGDCDDADDSVSPDKKEVCDGKDNNCNGYVDDGNVQTWLWPDRDGDGDVSDDDGYGYLENDTNYEAAEWMIYSCPALSPGYAEYSGYFDCDDFNAAINHAAIDDTVDGIDQNCDKVDGQ